MRPVRIYAPKQTPCLPYAPPVEDAEQSASSQPTPSRRKPCPAPAVGEPATTSPQFPGQSATRHCAVITNPGPRKNGSISGKTRTHASAAALPFASCTSAFVALPTILAPAPRSLLAAPSPSRKAAIGSGARPLHLLGSARNGLLSHGLVSPGVHCVTGETTDAVFACFNLYRSASRV
jgi:hypothetical protein